LKQSLVSVIVPSYNHGIYIPDALDSVLNQTHKNVEVIVVDDGSTDNTQDVVARYGDQVHYEYQLNQGLAVARNTGLRLAAGDFVVFLDADDLLLSRMIEKSLMRFEAEPEAGVVHCGWINATADLSDVHWRVMPVCEGLLFHTLAHTIPFPCHSMLLPMPVVREAGAFDQTIETCADWDGWLRIAGSRSRWPSIKKPLIITRMRPVSMSRDASISFSAGKEVILRAHAADLRVETAHRQFSLGCSCKASDDAVWKWLLNCLSFAIAQGNVDAAYALLEQEGHARKTTVEPTDMAFMVKCLWYATATPFGDWELLWPKVRKPLFEFFLRLEERSGTVGLALQGLAKIIPDEWVAPDARAEALSGRMLLRALGRRIQSRVLGS